MQWLQIHLHVDKAQVEIAETLFEQLGALSVTLDDAQDQALLEPLPGETPLWDRVIVTGIFQQDQLKIDADSLVQFIQSQMINHQVSYEWLADQVWERAWMDHYQPIQCADDLWIVPEWLDPPDPKATNIKLDPGLAFGTGNHASTFLCLQWLATQELKDCIVVDYGCGSGILAVAAVLLGAKQVFATDIDPQAVLATQQNAALNQVENRLWVGLPEQFDQEMQHKQADVLIANILAAPLVQLCPRFAQITKTDAKIALAGVIKSQVDEVKSGYQQFFTMDDQVAERDEDWCRLTGSRNSETVD